MRNHKGFSFTEILVAAALLGGISLGVMQLMNNMQKGQKSSEIKMEVLDLRRRIVTTMADKFACEKTFGSKKIGDDIDVIKNAKGVIIVKKNQEVANKRLKITRIYTKDPKPPRPLGNDMREIELHVDFENLMKNHSYGAKKTFSTLMTVEATGPNATITRCFDDRENAVMTAINEAGGEICRVLGGRWVKGEALNKRCTTAPCEQGYYLSGIKTHPDTGQEIFKCTSYTEKCPDGQYLTGYDAGDPPKPNCVFLGRKKSETSGLCKANEYLRGYDSKGEKVCNKIGTTSEMGNGNCAPGYYLQGYNNQGQKVCRNLKEEVEGDFALLDEKCKIKYRLEMGGHTASGEVKIRVKKGEESGSHGRISLKDTDNECKGDRGGCYIQLWTECN